MRTKLFVCLIAAACCYLALGAQPAMAGTGASVNMDHCANGSPFSVANYAIACGTTTNQAWVNADLNGQNSQYREGDSVPYRADIAGLANGTWTIHLKYEFTNNGRYALDRLTSYNLNQAATPCAGITGCSSAFTYTIPGEAAGQGTGVPALANGGNLTTWTGSPLPGDLDTLSGYDTKAGVTDASKQMTVWTVGTGTATFVSAGQNWTGTQSGSFNDGLLLQSGVTSGTSTREYAMIVTVANCPTAGCELILGWSTHIASAFDWGVGNSAAAISGAPYHMMIVGVDHADGTAGGNKDESFQRALITQTATLKKSCSTADTFNLLVGGVQYLAGITSTTAASCGGSTQTIGVLAATSTSMSESAGPGADLSIYNTTWSCSDNTSGTGQSFNVTVPGGLNTICTFTNIRKTHLKLTNSVNLTYGGNAATTDFTLSAANSTTTVLSGAGGAEGDVQPDTYTLASTSLTGYTNGSWSCDAGTLVGNQLTLATGDRANCSIVSSSQPATIVINVSTTGLDGTFNFTVSGTTGSTPSITTSSLSGTNTLTSIVAGSYSVAETVPSTWILNSASCNAGSSTGTAQYTFSIAPGATVTCSFALTPRTHLALSNSVDNTWGGTAIPANFTVSATKQGSGSAAISGAGSAAGDVQPATYILSETGVTGYSSGNWSCDAGTLSGNQLTLAIGTYASCSIVNGAIPGTIVIVADTKGANGTFGFNVDGPTASQPSITTTGTPNGTGTVTVGPVIAGSYNVSEITIPTGFTLTDLSCTVGLASQTNQQNIPTQWGFTVPLGGTVTCTFIDSSSQSTRTQGFWATHTGLANAVWSGQNLPSTAISSVTGSGDEFLCTTTPITSIALTGQNQLMGGFWSSISQTSTGGKRANLDQARMQMLQQYLAAVLNVHMFGSGNEAMLATARAAYCGNSVSAIQAQVGILGTFNASGDAIAFTPGSSATTPLSKSQAALAFWDTTKR